MQRDDLYHDIELDPDNFGPLALHNIEKKLYFDKQGTCSSSDGYIISIWSIIKIGFGKVEPGRGKATFEVKYSAIVFKPFKGEVLPAVVENVNKVD